MNIEDIITLEDNKDYMILDIIDFNKDKYIYFVGIDKDDNPTSEYIYLKVVEENGGYYTEEVQDDNVLKAIVTIFTNNYLNDSINDEQDV